jgi:hypothetical protein
MFVLTSLIIHQIFNKIKFCLEKIVKFRKLGKNEELGQGAGGRGQGAGGREKGQTSSPHRWV